MKIKQIEEKKCPNLSNVTNTIIFTKFHNSRVDWLLLILYKLTVDTTLISIINNLSPQTIVKFVMPLDSL